MIPTDSNPEIAAKDRMRRKIQKGLMSRAKKEAKDDPAVGTFSKDKLRKLAYQRLNTKKIRDKVGL